MHIWLDLLMAEPEAVSAGDDDNATPAEGGHSDVTFIDDDLADL